jgi:hypothetical protein
MFAEHTNNTNTMTRIAIIGNVNGARMCAKGWEDRFTQPSLQKVTNK